MITIREFKEKDIPQLTALWNEVTAEGNSFPGDKILTEQEAQGMFARQTLTAVAEREGKLVGFYILHPNHEGHCAHVANASYGVTGSCRGESIGEQLVRHSLAMTKEKGFVALQFNAVVATNFAAIRLYLKLGFTVVGTIPNGYRFSDGTFADLLLFYHAA